MKSNIKGRWKESAESQRRRRLRLRYNITIEDYNRMINNQNSKCAICKVVEHTESRKLCVDHDHNTGEVRGLLCHGCNIAVAVIEKGKDFTNSILNYLS